MKQEHLIVLINPIQKVKSNNHILLLIKTLEEQFFILEFYKLIYQ